MKKIILLSLICVEFLVAIPTTANMLSTQKFSRNSDSHSERLRQRDQNALPTQTRPPYQIGYTVHYRNPGDRKWTLEGFHLARRDAQIAARRLQRNGFRTKIQSRAEAERRSDRSRDF
jgi:hypothetical protein